MNHNNTGNTEQPELLKKLLNNFGLTNPNKLTNWKNEPQVSDLMGDYRNASSSHSYHMTNIRKWRDLLEVESDKSKLKKGRSGVAPKVIRRLAEWRHASLTSTFLNEKSLFKVKANSPKYIQSAIQNELVLNFQFNSLINKVKFINDYVRTATDEGTVIVRVGWEESFQTKEKELPVYEYVQADLNQQQMIQEVLSRIAQEQEQTGVEDAADTETFNQLDEDFQESVKASAEYQQPVIAVNTGKTQIVKESVQVKNRPAIEVINANNLVIDPTCNGDFAKAKFAVYTYKTDLSSLKAAGIYKNLDMVTGASTNESIANDIANMPEEIFSKLIDGESIEDSFRFSDKPRQVLTAYEYWGYYDIDGTGIVQGFVATIVGGIMIRLERNPFPDNELPFVIVPYMPVKESLYGEPDASLIEDNQKVITALMRSMVDINARSASGQTAMPRGFLDTYNMKKFRKGEDYEYNPSGVHPSDAVFMHKANEIPQSVMALIQSQFAEAEAATGIKSFQQGIDGNAYGQSVAGMSQAVTAMTQRESDVVFRLSHGLAEIGNKIIAMNAVWLNEEETVAITDSEFINITREDLAGDFYLAVDTKSNTESEGKAQQLTFMMQTLGNTVPWDVTQMFLTEISRLYNLDSVTNMLQKYQPQPDPVEQEKQQLEIAELKAKVQKLQDESEYYQARSDFIQAQIGQTQADTDLKNLDFMEQQEGVKHARQREIVKAQAEAQNKGKLATEALKGANQENKTRLDNDSKERIAKAKDRENSSNNSGNKGKSSKKPRFSGQSTRNLRQLPNPELNALPKGLYTAEGLGNYIRGDASTSVGNET